MFDEIFQPNHRSTARRRKKRQAGFTIFEVTMATFVMAMGISTSIVGITAGFKQLDVARNITLSSQVLQSEMERLRLMNWTDIAALTGSSTVDLESVFTDDEALAERFTLLRTVGDVTGKVGEMKEITLQCSWTGIDNRTLSRQFTTYYTKNGLYDYYYTLARP